MGAHAGEKNPSAMDEVANGKLSLANCRKSLSAHRFRPGNYEGIVRGNVVALERAACDTHDQAQCRATAGMCGANTSHRDLTKGKTLVFPPTPPTCDPAGE